MKLLTLILAVLLSGYQTGRQAATTSDEWQSPQLLSLNKEAPHAWFFSFADVESARKVLPEHSAYWRSLDGEWSFHWATDPSQRPADFFRPDYDDTAWDRISVPSNWNVAGLGHDGSQRYGTPLYVNIGVAWWTGARKMTGAWA